MQPSRYNYEVSKDKAHLIFNGLYLSCAILNDDEFFRYQNDQLFEAEKSQLAKLKMLVPDDLDEVEKVLYLHRKATLLDRRLYVRVYTTFACNANCPYCYQKGVFAKTMTREVADSFCDFIADKLEDKMPLVVEWFGGEPLVNCEIISYICDKLSTIVSMKNSYFYSTIVTNGFLFTNTLIEKAKEKWNLRKAQITLDGLKSSYENIKGFKQANAFEKVLDNIDSLLERDIHVVVRLNYDENNFEEILQLIDFLRVRFPMKKNLNLYAKKIMTQDGDNSFVASGETDLIIFKKLYKCGFVPNILDTIQRRDNVCMAHMLNEFIVLPDGSLSKCSQDLEANKGTLQEGFDEDKLVSWLTPSIPDECLNCKCLPLCNGGCMYERFLHKPFCFISERLLLKKLEMILNEYLETQ